MLEHLSHIAEVAVVVVPFFIWLIRWTRKLETTISLNQQVVKVHLPFVYKRLRDHDLALALVPVDHPDIGIVNGNNHD